MFKHKKKTNPTLTVISSVKLKNKSDFQAVSLDKSHISLVKTQEAAKVSLTKKGLGDKKFAVCVVFDNSGSMGEWGFDFYRKGFVQKLGEFALGYAFEIDTDGMIPVGVFGTHFQWASDDLTQDSYRGFIQSQGWNGNGGGTDTAQALKAADELFDQCDDPAVIVVVTDGRPNSESAVIKQLEYMSRKPRIVKWFTIGDDPEALRFAHKIDDDLCGLVDNVDSKNYTGEQLNRMTSEQFAADMSDELDTWVADATAAGILT